jgi:uncharacterized OB-fold protein
MHGKKENERVTGPIESSPLAQYRAHLRKNELAYQFSRTQGKAVFYPRLGPELEWRISRGLGTVYAATVIVSKTGSYNVVLVDCDEGFRLMSRLDEVGNVAPAIGMRVQFRVGATEDGTPIPVFVPAQRDAA